MYKKIVHSDWLALFTVWKLKKKKKGHLYESSQKKAPVYLWALTVTEWERGPYLGFSDKVLNRFTQVDHKSFEDAFSSDVDVHSLWRIAIISH